jgi:hypothetical protein
MCHDVGQREFVAAVADVLEAPTAAHPFARLLAWLQSVAPYEAREVLTLRRDH